ncbi:methionine synthase reductase-like [Gigantopelta aegis]|uniref:methionine synthase reductase-like n=1 Tax=Gigantopelta aegis TaxID=1735272 RepID=UPI001B8890A7|nr:methionine synthase reductase-like [Gigantopelta aegis]
MPVKTTDRFLLLYGSQTGQAQAISEEIAEKAEQEGLHAEVHCLSLTEKKFNIEREKCVVFVTSTTGDGDPPDTAAKFVRRLKKKTLSDSYLSHLNYALLGLGDSNYTNFCNCAKSLEKRLTELGAKPFYTSGFADDGVGLEVVVEPWMDGLFPAIKSFLGKCETNNTIEDFNNSGSSVVLSYVSVDSSSIRLSPNCDVVMETHEADSSLTTTVVTTSSIDSCMSDQVVTTSSVDNHLSDKVVTTSSVDNHLSDKVVTTSSGDTVVTTSSVDSRMSDKVVTTISVDNRVNDNVLDSSSTRTSVENDSFVTIDVSSSGAGLSESKRETTNTDASLPGNETDLQARSLTHSLPPLCESSLTLPFLPPKFLSLVFQPEESLDLNVTLQNGCPFPSAASNVTIATVTSAKRLTTQDAVKKTLLLTLNLKESNMKCEAGDAISVICPNPLSEVERLLDRLGLKEKAQVPVLFDVLPNTKKRNAAVPPYFPQRTTLQHLLQTCVDIRDPPKKALLRCLVDFISDGIEKRRLQELCSRQGAEDYGTYIRQAGLSLLDILSAFPSCMPPIDSVLEHLPRLQPRPYSICCHPARSGLIQICFNVVTMEEVDGRSYPRSGLCTGWLDSLTGAIQGDGPAEASNEIEQQLQSLSLAPPIEVPVFTRTNQQFHPPEDASVPMILIGPGTGVAPFIGFLQQRLSQMEKGDNCGAVWLFYGCRHRKKDFLFRKELEDFQSSGVLTKLSISVSREEGVTECTKYVQESIVDNGQSLVTLMDEGAVVYVCGDAKNMAKDVNAAFCTIVQENKSLSESDASGFVMKMRLHKKYLEDVWT